MAKQQESPYALPARHELIVIGTSAGGIQALQEVLKDLPADFPAAICIVLHIPAEGPSLLPRILQRSSALPVRHALDGETIVPGRVYIAPPDRHLLVEAGRLLVRHGPRENRHRPAVDPLFRSAALAYGPRLIGVILTGALNDGTAGLAIVKRLGGVAIVQDPAEALFPSMPTSAQRHVAIDYSVPLAEIAATLTRVAHEPSGPRPIAQVEDVVVEERWMRGERVDMESLAEIGTPSNLTCPECHGPLWELHDKSLLRFRCRTGHGFTAESMLADQAKGLEDALWLAVNTLEERALVSDRLATDAAGRRHGYVATRFTEKALEARRQAEIIRQVILQTAGAAGIDEIALKEEAQQGD
jgi:two-component system chemotaxis response regulator CheB